MKFSRLFQSSTGIIEALVLSFAAATIAQAGALEMNTDRPGSDIASEHVGTVEACLTLCDDTKGCLAFTFVPDDRSRPLKSAGQCWLKGAIARGFPAKGMVSGVMATNTLSSDFSPEVQDARAQQERIESGPEADLIIRAGDVDNLGFGWPQGFRLFEGHNTPKHGWPWTPRQNDASGTDRIMIGERLADSSARGFGDGYHDSAEAVRTEPIIMPLGALPAQVDAAVLQLFVDDFQAPSAFNVPERGNFTMTLNGIPAYRAGRLLTTLDQTGPIGKLITLPLPQDLVLVPYNTIEIVIDETSGANDGFAVDFARLLINPGPPLKPAAVEGIVRDASTGAPVARAAVSVALTTAETGEDGTFQLDPIYSGLVLVEALAEGYSPGAAQLDVLAGQTGQVELMLEPAVASACEQLASEVARTGRATLNSVHFDFNSSVLRSDSVAALVAARDLLIDGQGIWVVEGHTDNVGGADYNMGLSQERAQSVVNWLVREGVTQDRLQARGFGFTRPTADNATEAGRALNRRVDLVLAEGSLDDSASPVRCR